MDKLTLARTYEPVLHFSKDGDDRPEYFFPMAVDDYVAQSRLFRKKEGAVNDKPTLEVLGQMRPAESRDFYLTFAADSVIKEHPSLWERFNQGGLTFYSVEGEMESYLVVDSEEAYSFAVQDEGLQAMGSDDPFDDDDSVAFDGADGESEGFFKMVDLPTKLPPAVRDKALEKYAPFRDFSAHAPIYYYHVMPIRGYLVIQYWFFYAFNDWGSSHKGVNDHEGDWETIFVFLQNDQPAYTAYSVHDEPAWRHTHRWEDPARERVDDDHPVVYVGCGSHASYTDSGVNNIKGVVKDYHEGQSGVAIGPGADVAWGQPVDLAEMPWALNFAGGWGALMKRLNVGFLAPGTQAPTGPVWHQQQWEAPVDWARLPS